MGTSSELRTDAVSLPAVPLSVGPAHGSSGGLAEGARVEVRTRFDGHWAAGFRVAAAHGGGYLISRCSDGQVLPVVFEVEELRLSAAGPVPRAVPGG